MSEATDYGFVWGPMTVERMAHDEDKLGWVLSVQTPTAEVQIRVSPGGRVTEVQELVPRAARGRKT